MQSALDQSHVVNLQVGSDGSVAQIDDADEPDEEASELRPNYMRHAFDENLALHMTDFELQSLADEIQRGIDSDLADRRDWDMIAAQAVEYLGLKVMQETGATNVSGGSLSRVWDPLMLEATITFWANAVAEFLPADGPCKVRDDSPPPVDLGPPSPMMGHNGGPSLVEADAISPPGESREDLAGAFELDFNHYLTTGDRAYYQDFNRMLFSLGPTGTQFRKVYWCPLRGRPVSEWVRATNLVVSSDATSLQTAARVTELIKTSQAQAKRLMRAGWWRKCDLLTPNETQTEYDKEVGEAEGVKRMPTLAHDHQHTIQECYVELDLDGFWHTEEDGERSGQPLPYRVAIDKDSKQIVEIRRMWREEDPLFQARQRYVMFGMIPGLGFYYLGFMHILGNAELTLTSIGRQLLDAGQFDNFPGGVMQKGMGRQVDTDIRPEPGTFVEIDMMGAKSIQDVIMPFPYKGASATLAQLAGELTGRFQKLAGAAEVPVGEGTADVPVGTMMAMIEQSTKVLAAVHKGLHASRAEELELLRELIAEDPSVLLRNNRRPARQWQAAEEFRDLDMVPSSDPNVPSQLHRIMAATALVQIAGQMPGVFDPHWVAKNAMRAIRMEIPQEAFAPPPQGPQGPPPDPAKMMMAQAAVQKAQTDAQRAQLEAQMQGAETQRKAAEAVTTAENDRQTAALNAQAQQAKLDSQERIAGVQEATEHMRLAAEVAKNAHAAKMAEAQHGLAQQQHGFTQQQHHDQQRALGAGIVGNPGSPNV